MPESSATSLSAAQNSYPLSPMQQGMLFDSLSGRTSGVGIEQIVVRCEEALDAERLRNAWTRLVAHHPVLRSSFCWKGVPAPVQAVCEEIQLPWDDQDWRALDEEKQSAKRQTYLANDRQRGFEMDRPPLMRFALFRLQDSVHEFVWTFHHAILDGRSLLILLEDAFKIYDSADVQLRSSRPYRDYIDWLQETDRSSSEPFWRKLLQGFYSPTQLRVEEPADGTDTVTGHGEAEIRLPETLTASIRETAEQCSVTANTILQGAWAILLSRYSREDDVVYGATRAGRHWGGRKATDEVGIFINSLPVRVSVPANARLDEWLRGLRQQHVDVREHEHVSLTDVQGWSDVPHGAPLFETLVVFENFLLESELKTRNESWSRRSLSLLEETSLPLTLAGYLEAELLLRIEYDRSRFAGATISRMLTHLQTLLEGMVSQPNATIASLPILPAEEREQLLGAWNATEAERPANKGVHHLFEAQAVATPEKAAVVEEDGELSYTELNNRANQLAHHLMDMGVTTDVPVGLFVERSLDMTVGVLGILKAGGAYLPLDPGYPEERLEFMIHDSGTPVIVTQERLASTLPANSCRLVTLDANPSPITEASESNPNVPFSTTDLAYMMYTSGSTGKPKGVQVPHRGVANHCLASLEQYGIKHSDRVLQFFSINFDGSVEELFPAWACGATVVLRSADMLASTASFMSWIERYGITVIDLPTAYWHELVNGLALSGDTLPAALRGVIVGGEKASMSAYKRWVEVSGGKVRWFNTYGPTECTVVSTVYEPDESIGRSEEERDLPIGRPIANTQIYVVDKSLQPVPIGVPGEMLIGGNGVARGYLNRPDLTEERFIEDPFGKSASGRLYRTGDLVRYLPDGNIEFMGRTDFQVKFRGFRIEPGEIERAIEQHPAVRESVVLMREDTPGQKYLAAYWTAGDGDVSPTEPRGHLKETLPEYMVPTAYVLLDAFPTTPNGKVDRKALPQPDSSGLESGAPYVAPRNKTESVLVEIWSEVLGVEKVGINDNFFELGGHSLLTLQVLDRAHREGFDMTPQDMFNHPTVGELAATIADGSDEDVEWSSLVPLQPNGSRLPLFLVHTTPGDILGYGNLVHHLGPDQPCYGLQSLGLHEPDRAHQTIEEMAAYYVDHVLSVQPEGPYALGGWCYGGIVAVEMARVLIKMGHEIAVLALIETWAIKPGFKRPCYYADRARAFAMMGPSRTLRYVRAKVARKLKPHKQTDTEVLAVDLEYGDLKNRKLVLKTNMAAVEQYRTKPYPGRVTLFNVEEVSENTVPDPNAGWSTLAAEIETHFVPSSHTDILQEPQVITLANLIRESMDRRQS